VYEALSAAGHNVTLKHSDQPEIELLDGYRYLAEDDDSNLGWRIVTMANPINDSSDGAVRKALSDNRPLVELLPTPYVTEHRNNASVVRAILNGDPTDPASVLRLAAAVDLTAEQLPAALLGAPPAVPEPEDPTAPTTICTSIVGSKGLSAAHVFIVGFNNGHIPAHPDHISDQDVCGMLVALSRTRKCCYLVSCGRFAGAIVAPSAFLRWIDPVRISHRAINAQSFKGDAR